VTSTERNSGAAIATLREAAISRRAVAAVTARAAIAASCVAASAGRYRCGLVLTVDHIDIAALAAERFLSHHTAAVAAAAAVAAKAAPTGKRRAAVTALRGPIIDQVQVVFVANCPRDVGNTDQNSVAAIATKREAAISRPAVAALAAVAARSTSCVAAFAAISYEDDVAAVAADRELARHDATVAALVAIAAIAPVTTKRSAA
jgi:hypothetical protein